MTLAQLLLLLDRHIAAHKIPEPPDGTRPGGSPTPRAERGSVSDLLSLAAMPRG